MNVNKTVKEIANIINGKVVGDENFVISGFSKIDSAKQGDITFLSNPKYSDAAGKTAASVIIVADDNIINGKICIQVENPSLSVTNLLSYIVKEKSSYSPGVDDSAKIAENVCLGKNVYIGPNVVIEEDVIIGDNSIVCAGVFIGKRSQIGIDGYFYPNVVIREDSIVGNKVIIQSNTVIGSDGFGYNTIEGKHYKIPQIGFVEIHDDVEIGSNVTIDRARFDKTVIGEGTKIDNLVQIAHNVIIGKNCIIVAQVGISGSTKVGDNVTIAGQAGTAGHIEIGSNSIIAGRAGVTKNVPPNVVYSGYPAKSHMREKRIKACLSRLPELVKRIRELEKILISR